MNWAAILGAEKTFNLLEKRYRTWGARADENLALTYAKGQERLPQENVPTSPWPVHNGKILPILGSGNRKAKT